MANARQRSNDVRVLDSLGLRRIVAVLQRAPRPVIALPGKGLFRVLLQGSGFRLAVQGGDPCVGFFITWTISATSRKEAQEQALMKTRSNWSGWSLLSLDTGLPKPVLEVLESEEVEGWCRFRERTGYVFYRHDDVDSAEEHEPVHLALQPTPQSRRG